MSAGGSKFDLIVDDLPEGLPIPNFFSLLESIPFWNKHNSSHVEVFFEFVFAYLADNACMLITIPELELSKGM